MSIKNSLGERWPYYAAFVRIAGLTVLLMMVFNLVVFRVGGLDEAIKASLLHREGGWLTLLQWEAGWLAITFYVVWWGIFYVYDYRLDGEDISDSSIVPLPPFPRPQYP